MSSWTDLQANTLAWAPAFSKTNALKSYSFADFIKRFCSAFDHPLGHDNASKQLLNLWQGTQSVDDFLIEFRILAAESSWGSDALQGILLNSLSEQIKGKLSFFKT